MRGWSRCYAMQTNLTFTLKYNYLLGLSRQKQHHYSFYRDMKVITLKKRLLVNGYIMSNLVKKTSCTFA